MLDYEDINDTAICPHCGRRMTAPLMRHPLVTRDEHDDCAREDEPLRRREAIRQLHRDTARMLRRQGFAERAAIHEFFAGRV